MSSKTSHGQSHQCLVIFWTLYSLWWEDNPAGENALKIPILNAQFPIWSQILLWIVFRSWQLFVRTKYALKYLKSSLSSAIMCLCHALYAMLRILFKKRKINHLFMWRYLWYDASSYPEHAFMNIVVVVEYRCINLTRFYSIPSAITQRTILLWDLV